MKSFHLVAATTLALMGFGIAIAGEPADPGTHITHSKEMKNNQGVKEGDPMQNAPKPAQAPDQTSPPEQQAAPKKGTHRVHSKEMKNNRGIKDGDEMPNQ